MAMVLFYNRINWEDFPSVNTAINAIRLNLMDYAVKTMDERTVALDTAKAEKSVVLNTIQDWSLDEETGIITITKVNGEQIMFDLNIEKIPIKFELSEDGILTMTTEDGSKFTANIGAMIPVIVFENSDTISVTKISNRTELATNFSKYVHEFESAFTGNIVVKVVPLGDSTGQYNATLVYENGTMDIKSGGGVDEEEFVFAVESLSKITVSSLTSNNIVALYAEVVTNEIRYRFDVKDGSIKDKHLEPNYLAKIKVQAENAELSATASAESATTASEKAIVAESYAVGGTGTRDGEDTDNAKYYAEQAKETIESLEFPMPISKGGTGGTTAKEAQYNLLNDIPERTATLTDSDYSAILLASPSKTNGVLAKVKLSVIWTWVKGKIESILGLTATSYGGNATTATTASKLSNTAAIGSTTKPVYFNANGVPVAGKYTLADACARGVKSASAVSSLGWGTNNNYVPDITLLAFWNGRYNDSASNLAYCNKGAFGTMATKDAANYTPVANLITTVAGKPLDATMGKELADRLTTVESNLAEGKVKFQVTEDGTLQYSVYTEDA